MSSDDLFWTTPDRIEKDGHIGPVDATQLPRFAGPATFARLPRIDEVEHTDVAVMGIPFDTGVSYRSGARFGPTHVRESSRLMRPYHPVLDTDPFGAQQVADAGDVGVNPYDIDEAMGTVERAASALTARGSRIVSIGGDHTIALPLLRNAHRHHGKVALIHFDAHLDTWDTYFGQPYTHGTPFRRAFEEGLIDTDAVMHVGTRGPLYGKKDLDDDASFGFSHITCEAIMRRGVDDVVEQIRSVLDDRPTYLSIDIDVLDPAHAPGTGTPEAGGMTSRELLAILRGLRGTRLIGADVVEVSPAYDHAELTGIAAAHVVYDLIALMGLSTEGGAR